MTLTNKLNWLMGVWEESDIERCTWKTYVECNPRRVNPKETICYHCNGQDTKCESYTNTFWN